MESNQVDPEEDDLEMEYYYYELDLLVDDNDYYLSGCDI